MSATAIYHSPRFLEHDTGPGHPERPDRLLAIVAAMKTAGLWDRCQHPSFGPAPLEKIHRIHDPAYVLRVQRACAAGEPFIDTPDSAICPASHDIALLASGAAIAAVDAVMSGAAGDAMCLPRPPGHHAERDRSMGFCLYNHVAVAAQHAIDAHRLARVAIVDFDVHHGNGTQHSFEDRGDVLFISLHQHPRTLYPGTGFAHETGIGAGKGCTLNIPLMPGGGDDVYRQAFEEAVVPKLDDFRPQLLLASAGFDAAEGDPLAAMRVTPDGFAWIGRTLRDAALRHCGGKLVSTLEGGYDLDQLAASVVAYLGAMVA